METHHHDASKDKLSHHHVLPTQTALAVGAALLVLTAITVWVAQIDLGPINFLVAVLVASLKATLVALVFMGLKYDKKENGLIFATSFVFLMIFVVLTSTDLFFRGDVYVKGPLMLASAGGPPKFKKPWIRTEAIAARGQEIFKANCTSCHGDQGQGNGPGASACNPRPRNFTSGEGWKNGRSPAKVFKTLKEGLAGSAMASYATLPAEDRWAAAHYVLSLGPPPGADTPADFAAVKVDPTQETAMAEVEKTVPVDFVIDRMSEKD